MCCCAKPTVNGEMGFQWQPNDAPSILKPYAPLLEEGETLLYDEPGRCGGLDAHCHHYRLVKRYSSVYLLVQHGGGREAIRLSTVPAFMIMLQALDSTARYWLFHTLYYAASDARREATDNTRTYYAQAFIEGRLKRKKRNHRYYCEVQSAVMEGR